MRRLRKPCEEHDRYEPHNWQKPDGDYAACPGGEFLPEGALVIEKVDGEWPHESVMRLARHLRGSERTHWKNAAESRNFQAQARSIFDALASRVGESE